MIKLLLLAIWAALAAVLFAAINLYAIAKIVGARPKRPKKTKPAKIPDMAIDEMERVAQDKASSAAALGGVIEAMIAYHAIPEKKDGKANKDAKRQLDLIFTMASHKNLSAEARSTMYKRLSEANPSYAKEFEKAAAAPLK